MTDHRLVARKGIRGRVAASGPRPRAEREDHRYADGEIGQPFTSGNDAVWSPVIEQRLRSSGEAVDVARRLKSHVELKIAAMMLARGRRHSEAVINHVPCGSQRGEDYRGCHEALSAFLPEGATLTVHGTTQEGKHYSHTYRGGA